MNTVMRMAAVFFLLVALSARADGDARFYGGSCDGWGRDTMVHAWTLDDEPQLSLWSGTDQFFNWTASEGTLSPVSVGVWRSLGSVTNGGSLSIRLPSGWQCRFNGDAEIALGGSAGEKVGTACYSGDFRVVNIPITADFADGDTLTVTGLKLADLRFAQGDAGHLGLDVTGDGVADINDENHLQVCVVWSGGVNDGWGTIVSEASGFWIPRGTLISVY